MFKRISYGIEAQSALDACIVYLDGVAAYLGGRTPNLPDSSPLLKARFPSSKIISPAHLADRELDLEWPTVRAMIDDSRTTNHRFFDPWYFAAMLLLELPGGRLVVHSSNNNKYVYVGYAGAVKHENIAVRRIVANTPGWADTLDMRSHHDLRRPSLRFASKDVRAILGFKTKGFSKGRQNATSLALQLFREQLKLHGKAPGRSSLPGINSAPGIGLTASGYMRLLDAAFSLADAMHDRYSLDGANRES